MVTAMLAPDCTEEALLSGAEALRWNCTDSVAEEVTVKEILVKTQNPVATVEMSQSIMHYVCQHVICVQMTTETAGESVSNALKKYSGTKTLSLLILNQNQNLLDSLVRSSAMFANSKTWTAGRDVTPASIHISTMIVKMDKLKKMMSLTSTSAIAISKTMPVGGIVTEKRSMMSRTTGKIITEKITTERMVKRTRGSRTMGKIITEKITTEKMVRRTKGSRTMEKITTERITMERMVKRTKESRTMAKIITEKTTMENKSTEFPSLLAWKLYQ